MLALMCSIYRDENYIPRNRPEIYEKCSKMLFERWDKSRGIIAERPFETHFEAILADVAYWIYGSPNARSGVRRLELIARVTDYLLAWRFDDYLDAEAAAISFVDFCRSRAWVLTDVGSTTREPLISSPIPPSLSTSHQVRCSVSTRGPAR